MKNENEPGDHINDLFKILVGVPVEDRDEIRSFLQTNRGLIIMARALTVALKMLKTEYFDPKDPMILRDIESMKVMLRVVTSFLFTEEVINDEETFVATLQNLFPDINLSEWKL